MWINNSDALFSYEKFYKVTNSRFLYRNKPNGGYWLAKYNENEQFKSDWHQWCNDESYQLKTQNYIYKLCSNAKIFSINDRDDFNYLRINFPIVYTNKLEQIEYICIDFEKVAIIFDGVYLTRKGLVDNKPNLDAWDVASLVVFKPEILINIGTNFE